MLRFSFSSSFSPIQVSEPYLNTQKTLQQHSYSRSSGILFLPSVSLGKDKNTVAFSVISLTWNTTE